MEYPQFCRASLRRYGTARVAYSLGSRLERRPSIDKECRPDWEGIQSATARWHIDDVVTPGAVTAAPPPSAPFRSRWSERLRPGTRRLLEIPAARDCEPQPATGHKSPRHCKVCPTRWTRSRRQRRRWHPLQISHDLGGCRRQPEARSFNLPTARRRQLRRSGPAAGARQTRLDRLVRLGPRH